MIRKEFIGASALRIDIRSVSYLSYRTYVHKTIRTRTDKVVIYRGRFASQNNT